MSDVVTVIKYMG